MDIGSPETEGGLSGAMEDTVSTGLRVIGLRLTSYAIGLVASVLIARALGPEGRGMYALPIAFLGIVMVMNHIGLEHANVFLSAHGVGLRRLWANVSFAAVLIGFLTWVIISGLHATSAGLLGLPFSWIAVTMVQVPFLLQSLYWFNLLQLEGRVAPAAVASVVGVAVHAGICAVLFTAGSLTPFRVLLTTLALNGTTWLGLLLLCRRAGLVGARPDLSTMRRGIIFGLKAHVGLVAFFLLLRVDQLLVERILGFRELGFYSLAVTLAELMWVLTEPFAASVLPHQVRAAKGDDRRLGFATARMSLVISVIIAAVAWAVAPYVIPAVYGAAFEGSVWPFRLLLPGVVALSVQRPLGAILLKGGRPLLVSALGLIALTLNVALNVALLRELGIVAASVASTAAYLTLAVAYIAVTRSGAVAGWRDLVPRVRDLRQLLEGLPPLSRGRGGHAGRPVRVGIVIGTLDRGGTEGQVVAVANGLSSRGLDVTVVCLGKAGALAADPRLTAVELVEGRLRGNTPRLLRPLRVLRTLLVVRRTFRRQRPDIVHTFLHRANLLGVPVAKLVRTPVIVSSQRSLQDAVWSNSLLRPFERLSNRWSDVIVCNSAAVLEDAVHTGRVPAWKAKVIYNGVDARACEYTVPPHDVVRILVIANLIAYKGHSHLLHAFASALPRLRRETVRLELAGSGPEEKRLRAEAERLGIEDQVEFLGSVSDVRGLLRSCAFTVLPSLTEGLPNAVLESLACGRAVIASHVGGIPEILSNGGGIMVPPGNDGALADAIVALAADPDRARALGEQGRRIVARRFGVEQMVEDNLRLYLAVLAQKGISVASHGDPSVSWTLDESPLASDSAFEEELGPSDSFILGDAP